MPSIEAVFLGGPKKMVDSQGPWTSSIDRERTEGAVEVTVHGIVGDRATQPYHGGPDAALCVHLADHYRFWQQHYGLHLQAGAVGENLTLGGVTEEDVSIGDLVRIGTVLAQVSGPRVPCANQSRHVGRPDWVRLTVRENRTGFYMRVLEPGIFKTGDSWRLEQRPNQDACIPRVNRCMYLNFDPVYATHMLGMIGIGDWWVQQAAGRLADQKQHWTAAMKNQGADENVS